MMLTRRKRLLFRIHLSLGGRRWRGVEVMDGGGVRAMSEFNYVCASLKVAHIGWYDAAQPRQAENWRDGWITIDTTSSALGHSPHSSKSNGLLIAMSILLISKKENCKSALLPRCWLSAVETWVEEDRKLIKLMFSWVVLVGLSECTIRINEFWEISSSQCSIILPLFKSWI